MSDSLIDRYSDRSGVRFAHRHIGPDVGEQQQMLEFLGLSSREQLIEQAVPAEIRLTRPLALPEAVTEQEVHALLRERADQNRLHRSLIGMGYYPTVTPPVIARNILENPAWYTAYTPYQPEISQGRLEALLNFQTMVTDLTAMEIANASLLDEATAAAEAMTMARRMGRSPIDRFFVHEDTHPQTLAVLATRAEPIGIELVIGPIEDLDPTQVFGALLPSPTSSGNLVDWTREIDALHEAGAIAVVVTDLLACTLITPPGEMGADLVIGSAQRFGVPLGFGGPHAAFLAARNDAARLLPGRLVGVSTDTQGRPALRLALQTREQHIRREKATSNICTAQVLLANISGMYAVWHGPNGLRSIAERIHWFTSVLARAAQRAGLELRHDKWFDTLTLTNVDAPEIHRRGEQYGYEFRPVDDTTIGISLDETVNDAVLATILEILGLDGANLDNVNESSELPTGIPDDLQRRSEFLSHPVFHRYHSEHEMLRYIRRLSDQDLALDRTMIPLGSCTMKLNATIEMQPISWPEFSDLHPFTAATHSLGYQQMIAELERDLAEITGYAAVSLQPNAGSQGEFAGLLAIRAYHRSLGQPQRTICLIPSSAHGTNAASAIMAGFEVKVVNCEANGDVDLNDVATKIAQAGDRLGAIMVTYPSTHGVFETGISQLCAMIHAGGGQVYVDGANLNAMVGVSRPGDFGADVSHLNLHKTFCIPHGGGGPGVGPVAVKAHLAPFLPGHPLGGSDQVVGPVSAAPFGSAGILPIPWVYLRLMGPDGLREATEVAILSANYIAARLGDAYPVLYRGHAGRVAHECIIDLRQITKETGVTIDDVAKRLIDFGFHAPTVAFPVAGTLMIEPSESESLIEINRFCDAMLQIRSEIDNVANDIWDLESSPLRHAPHVAVDLLGEWARPYSRLLGAYPDGVVSPTKYFPPVSRIDAAYGDRNLMCTCGPVEDSHPVATPHILQVQ
jgi:glycine dehydrogenase